MSKTVNDLIGHYHRMFSFPGVRVLIVENITSALISAGLISLLVLNMLYVFVILSIIILFSQIVSAELTYRIAPNKRLLNRRRSLGLTFGSSILVFPAFLLATAGYLVAHNSPIIPYVVIVTSSALAMYLRYFTMLMYMDTSRARALGMALSQPILLIFGTYFSLAEQIPMRVDSVVLSLIFSLLMAELTIYILRISIDQTGHLDAMQLSRAFFAGWMGDQPEKLENVLETESVRQDLKINVFRVNSIKTGDSKAVLIAPSIHAGPFRNIGSSNLPAVVGNKIASELRVPAFVFHGAVSHERDLVHSIDTEMVADEIIRKLRAEPSKGVHHGMMVTRSAGQMVGGLGFGRQQLLWVSLAPLLSEDLPNKLQNEVEAYAAKRDVQTVSLLDTHSCLSDSEPSKEVMKSLENQIIQVIDKLVGGTPSELELGVSSVNLDHFSKDEIAGLGGVAALLKGSSGSMGILLFDSNNMTLKTRQRLDEELPRAFGAPVEIFTTDTHALVGIRAKKDYSPLGEKTPIELILNSSLEALKRAKSNAEPVTFASVTVYMKNIAVLGEKGIETLAHTTDVMVNLARRLLPITITLCALTSTIAAYLIP